MCIPHPDHGELRAIGSTQPSQRSIGILSCLLGCLILLSPLLSCTQRERSIPVARERRFSLGYGPGEGQLEAFEARGPVYRKIRILMKEGIFYLADGYGSRLTRFSSYGDILAMIYNPAAAVTPLFLSARQSGSEPGSSSTSVPLVRETAGRFASTYAFSSIGEIAVDASQTIYIEDRIGGTKRVIESGSGDILDRIVLRFDRTGAPAGYLGQEGERGTPFHTILSLQVTDRDDLVVVSASSTSWYVHWFDRRGTLLRQFVVARDALPLPEGESGLTASLDRIFPDTGARSLVMKLDYYRDIESGVGNSRSLVYDSSWIRSIRLEDGATEYSLRIPAVQPGSQAADPQTAPALVPSFIGLTAQDFVFMAVLDDGSTRVMTVPRSPSGRLRRYDIKIAPQEMLYASFHLSREGILSALLAGDEGAEVVWWRFDLKAQRTGFATGGQP